jgi:hypothetical protein
MATLVQWNNTRSAPSIFYLTDHINRFGNVCKWMNTYFDCGVYLKCLCKGQSALWLTVLFVVTRFGIPLSYRQHGRFCWVKVIPHSKPIILIAFKAITHVSVGNGPAITKALTVNMPDPHWSHFPNKNFSRMQHSGMLRRVTFVGTYVLEECCIHHQGGKNLWTRNNVRCN